MKIIYKEKIYSRVNRKLIRDNNNGEIYMELKPHVRFGNKCFYGKNALNYLKENNGEVLINVEELN